MEEQNPIETLTWMKNMTEDTKVVNLAEYRETKAELPHYLPINCPRECLQSLGFILGKHKDQTNIYAKFPEGWSLYLKDSSKELLLLDGDKNIRGKIATQTSGLTFLSLYRRYDILKYTAKSKVFYVAEDLKTGERLADTKKISVKNIEAVEEAENEMLDYLNQHFPEWESPVSYWS